MSSIHSRLALLPGGWARDARLTIEDGRIAAVEIATAAKLGDERHVAIIPGMPNLHSHAFQRGMAGLAEVAGPAADSFWTWREAMYRFALAMTPEQAEAIAGLAYIEMLEAGFTRVGEFHYLHHDRDGAPYAEIAEMATRIAAASETTGIRLTLLPVHYAHAGFGGMPPVPEQRRFTCELDQFAKLVDGCRAAIANVDGAVLGVAPHSLRAVTPEQLETVTGLVPDGPVHIHAAEQVREVEECLAWSGQRPVEWLLDHAGVDRRWCLIHATHMAGAETSRLAESGAVAGLCPVTEANLGDGTFPARAYLDAGGALGVGTDSNVRISVTGELRQLEYSQRLAQRQRNVLAAPGQSTGFALVDRGWRGGTQALGASDAGLAAGAPADIVALGTDLWEWDDGDGILDAWIFARGVRVEATWVAGKQVVTGGRHVRRDEVAANARTAMRSLLADA